MANLCKNILKQE